MIIHGRHTPSILRLAERLEDVDVGIRWGGGEVPGALNGLCYIATGQEQLEVFQVHEIKTPRFTTERFEAEEWWESGSTVIGRRANHTQGRDIRFCDRVRQRGHRRWYNSDYFVEWLPSVSEWRFHIFNGKSIARGKKVYTLDGPEPEQPIRSRKFGYKMVHDQVPPKGLRKLAKRSVEALGYQFGAVDVLELQDGSGCVLEVNSRPGLRSELVLNAYEKAIRRYTEENL